MRKKLFGIAAIAATVIALPLHAAAYAITLSYSVSPTTHSATSSVTSSFTADPSRTLVSSETILAAGESVCHAGAACAPANGTTVGSASATAHWTITFCSSQTQNFTITWTGTPDSNYTPPTGYSIVAEVNIASSFFGVNFNGYVVENSSSQYRIEIPSYPNLACHSSTYAAVQISQTLGSGVAIHTNPSNIGSNNSVSIKLHYSSGTDDSASTTYTTT
jgi:hypothetical protein